MPSPYRWVILGVTVIAFMQTHLHRMAFAPLIPTFVGDLGLSYAAAGTIQAAYFWTYTVVQVPVGVIADRWGTRRVMLACTALLTLGVVAFALSATFAASITARMLVGLGAAAVWVPAMRLVSEWFPPGEWARATGMVSAGGGIGGTLGLLLVPWLASVWGWRWAYGATAAPALLTLALIALCLRPGPGGTAAGASPGSLGTVLATRALWPFNLMVFFSYGAYFSFLTFLPAFLVKVLGATQPEAGAITGLITAGPVLSWPLARLVSDRAGRRPAGAGARLGGLPQRDGPSPVTGPGGPCILRARSGPPGRGRADRVSSGPARHGSRSRRGGRCRMAQAGAPHGGKRERLLYIEDDPQSRTLVRSVLEAAGYEVMEAEEGLSGIERALREPGNLILLDLNLPEVDGHTVAPILRTFPNRSATPIAA